MIERFDLGDGVVLQTATDADIAELDRNMRDLDREECRVWGHECQDFDGADNVWSVFMDGDLVCICGIGRFYDTQTHLSRFREYFLLSTKAVERHKVNYVRYSRKVADIVLNRMPSWIEVVYSLPIAKYTDSIRWQERILGFRREKELTINGVKHIVMARWKKGI